MGRSATMEISDSTIIENDCPGITVLVFSVNRLLGLTTYTPTTGAAAVPLVATGRKVTCTVAVSVMLGFSMVKNSLKPVPVKPSEKRNRVEGCAAPNTSVAPG